MVSVSKKEKKRIYDFRLGKTRGEEARRDANRGGRLGENKLFSKKGRDPLQKGEENIEIEVILFIL